jgi:outer membrane receptor protein involved in Fe transport
MSFSKNDNNRDFYQQFLQSNFMPTGLDSTQVQLTDNFVRSFYLNGNYNKPLNDSGTIYVSTGGSYSNNTNHNILSTSFLSKYNNSYVNNDLLSNNFYFHQTILQLRASLIIGLPKKWRIIAGVQAEHTQSDFEFIKGNSADANNAYFNFLPNITLRKEFNKEFNISWVYRETIRRPGITELNPNIDYSDPYNIRFGNPLIKPTLNDNYDFNITYVKPTFNLNGNIGYNHIKQVFNAVRTLIESGKTQTTYQNISNQDEYAASIWTGINITPKFKINLSGGVIYYKYNSLEKTLFKYIDGATEYGTLNYSYALNNLTTIEASNKYGSYINPQGKSHSNINMSISAMHKFFNKKLIASFAMIDPFGLQKYDGYTVGTNFNIISHSESNTQNFRLSLSYQFNKTILKSKLADKEKQSAINSLKP